MSTAEWLFAVARVQPCDRCSEFVHPIVEPPNRLGKLIDPRISLQPGIRTTVGGAIGLWGRIITAIPLDLPIPTRPGTVGGVTAILFAKPFGLLTSEVGRDLRKFALTMGHVLIQLAFSLLQFTLHVSRALGKLPLTMGHVLIQLGFPIVKHALEFATMFFNRALAFVQCSIMFLTCMLGMDVMFADFSIVSRKVAFKLVHRAFGEIVHPSRAQMFDRLPRMPDTRSKVIFTILLSVRLVLSRDMNLQFIAQVSSALLDRSRIFDFAVRVEFLRVTKQAINFAMQFVRSAGECARFLAFRCSQFARFGPILLRPQHGSPWRWQCGQQQCPRKTCNRDRSHQTHVYFLPPPAACGCHALYRAMAQLGGFLQKSGNVRVSFALRRFTRGLARFRALAA